MLPFRFHYSNHRLFGFCAHALSPRLRYPLGLAPEPTPLLLEALLAILVNHQLPQPLILRLQPPNPRLKRIGLVGQVFGCALQSLFALLLFDAEAGGGGGVAPAFVFVDGVFGRFVEGGGGGGVGRRGGLTFAGRVGNGVEGGSGGVVVAREAGLLDVLLGLVGGLEGEGPGVRGGVDGEERVYLGEGVVAWID